MTAITKNLPWFVKDLGVSIIGEECYSSIVEDLDFSNIPCLKYTLSKGLGIGIVLGGSIMKLPQIMLILSARSARGLSLPSYVLETLAYGITLGYSVRNGYAFSTYGENAFLVGQNIVILLLIIAYAPPTPWDLNNRAIKQQKVFITLFFVALSAYLLKSLSLSTLTLLQLSTLPLSLLSKIPQIRQNASAQSTGQLSSFAVFSQIAGCVARLYTTFQEVKDPVVVAGFALALLLNLVLGAQVWMYYGQGQEEKKLEDTVKAEKDLNGRGLGGGNGPSVASSAKTAATSTSTSHQQEALGGDIRERKVSPPSSRSGTPVSGRKWTRKAT